MLDSFDLQTELSAISQPETYDVPHEDEFADQEPNRLLEGLFERLLCCSRAKAMIIAAVEAVAESSDSIRDEEIFDVYRYLLKNAATTPGVVMGKLLDSISSGLKTELDATFRDVESGDQETYIAHKLPLELYAFLLAWFARASEKVKSTEDDAPAPAAKARRGRGGKAAGGRTASRNVRTETWSWQSQIPDTLALILKVLKLQTQRIWTNTPDKNNFLVAITKPAYAISENEQLMKSAEIRHAVFEVLCISVKSHGQALPLQIHITQSLQFFEHMSESMAECLYKLSTKYDHTQTADEVLRELAGMSFTNQDTKTPRAVARFLVTYAELYPRAAHRQLSLLINQQDSDVRLLRILHFNR